MYRIGIDVGGTFTDFVMIDAASGDAHFYKILSTPRDPSEAIVNGISQMLEKFGVRAEDVSFLGHGTTVATNMVLERKGVKTGLLTTAGFADVLEIGRQARPGLYDYTINPSKPLVRRAMRCGVDERLTHEGEILTPLNEGDVAASVEKFRSYGISAVAISFLHSYRNPVHEEQCRALVQAMMPDAYVSISSEVLPEFREYERTSTTVLNAYIGPRMKGYMARLVGRVQEIGLPVDVLTFHSNGGLLSTPAVEALPVLTCLSGPAAGVIGSAVLGAAIGDEKIITYDVGGTSTDVSLIADGRPTFTSNRIIDGFPIRMPMVDIHVVGAGGGSLARIDIGGALKMGPESAGADPGPIAYGLGGTEPTLTDANVVLGRLNPEHLLAGRVKVDRAAALREIEAQIAAPLGLDVAEASYGMIRVSIANMSRAIRAVSSAHGHDLSEFALYAFGGAGPLHAVEVAIECGLARVVVPREPGTMCARGILLADVSRDYVKTLLTRLDEAAWEALQPEIDAMRQRALAWLDGEGVAEAARDTLITLDCRYLGQTHDVPVVLPAGEEISAADFRKLFDAEHRKAFGYDIPGRGLEIVNLRGKAIGKVVKPQFAGAAAADAGLPAEISRRDAYFGEAGWVSTPVYERDHLPPGAELTGPLIIEEMSGTTVVPPGATVRVDALANLVIGGWQ